MRAAVAVALLASSCLDFPREDRIEDTRVLAIRTEPAEIMYSPLHLFAPAERPPLPLPTIDVEVEVWAFDPRGGAITRTMQLCPEGVRVGASGDPTCKRVDPDVFVDREPVDVQDEIAAVYLPRAGAVDVDVDVVGPAGLVPGFRETYAFTPAVIDSIIEDDEEGTPIPSIFPLLPRFAVEVENTSQPAVNEERAFKRLPLNLDLASPDLPAGFGADLAEALGFSICDAPIPAPGEEFVEGEAPCLHPRAPNANPDLVGFEITLNGENKLDEYTFADEAPVPRVALIRADAGARLTIEPVFRADSVENYQIVSFDIEESRVLLVNRVEDTALNWYTTDGDVSSSLTALQLDHEVGVDWNLATDKEPGERDTLVVVVQDQRGGSAVGTITVEYR